MAIYPDSPDPEVGPLAVTNGAYKAHFYTKGSGNSLSPFLSSKEKVMLFSVENRGLTEQGNTSSSLCFLNSMNA